MENFSLHRDLAQLVDQLAIYTVRYMQLMAEGGPESAIDGCKKKIHELQEAIQIKKAELPKNSTKDSSGSG